MSQAQAGERTEQATAKRKKDAREEGQVVRSIELVNAFSMMVMLGAISIFGSGIMENIRALLVSFFSGTDLPAAMTISAVTPFFLRAIKQFALIMAPLLGAAVLAGVLLNYLQVGFLFSTKAMMPKMSRVNAMQGFKRIFSQNTVIDLIKSILKITVLGVVAYNEYKKQIQKMPMLMTNDLDASLSAMVDILINVGFKMAIAWAILAPFDFFYQWWRHQKDLRMTKQEVKDEYKLTEGNPDIKGRIRSKQRQISRMRMIQAVKGADVVITNPTHYAIALSYQEGKSGAPVVVAKGKDYLAQRIKEKAREYHIEMVENRPLAQQLYFFCEVGDEIPEELYQAVAEILAYVYKLQRRISEVRT